MSISCSPGVALLIRLGSASPAIRVAPKASAKASKTLGAGVVPESQAYPQAQCGELARHLQGALEPAEFIDKPLGNGVATRPHAALRHSVDFSARLLAPLCYLVHELASKNPSRS